MPAFGPKTPTNTVPYLRSLIQRRCDVILAVGEAPVSAVTAEAAKHPKTRFVVAGKGVGGNVTSVDPRSPDLATVIADTVIRAVHAH
jgi:basic membrane lipoprotein Med (substrate-binding protein (PBP1-ABC) superfamily)